MGTFKSFEEIEAWQKARQLTRGIYKLSAEGPFSKDFAMKDQIRRASVSIMSNIAEGFDRGGSKEFIQFLSVAKGSAAEVKSQLYVALDQHYLDESVFKELFSIADETSRIIHGLTKYLKISKLKGIKFK